MVIDLLRRRVIGSFSPAMAKDLDYWKRVILPALLGIASAAIGITALHCACLVNDGKGLLIAGESGSGKSTLSLALAQSGLAFLSDDWTYLSRRNGGLIAWGPPSAIKLLPDAASFFADLSSWPVKPFLNGEMALEVDPEILGVRRTLSCQPKWLMFLQRNAEPVFKVTRISPAEASARFEGTLERLPASMEEARQQQLATIRELAECDSWLLECGGTPQALADRILRLCEQEGTTKT